MVQYIDFDIEYVLISNESGILIEILIFPHVSKCMYMYFFYCIKNVERNIQGRKTIFVMSMHKN